MLICFQYGFRQCRSGGAENRTPVFQTCCATFFTCVFVVSPTTEFADSAATYSDC